MVETTSQVPHCCSRVLSSCSGSQRVAPPVCNGSRVHHVTHCGMNTLGTLATPGTGIAIFPAKLLQMTGHFSLSSSLKVG